MIKPPIVLYPENGKDNVNAPHNGTLKIMKRKCLGKVKHKYFSAAEIALYDTPNNSTLVIYKCPFCKFFHLGNKQESDD